MNFYDLEVLIEIANTGSITKAAENLFTTQQNISRIIKKLENDVNPSVLNEDSFEKLSDIVCEIIKFEGFKNVLISLDEVNGIQEQVHNRLGAIIGDISLELELAITQCIMRKMATEDYEKTQIYAKWREYAVKIRKKVN